MIFRPRARSPRRAPVHVGVLAALVALVLTACSTDGSGASAPGSAPEQNPGEAADGAHSDDGTDAYTAAYAAAIRDEPGSPFSTSQSQCLARTLVEVVGGAAAFTELGISVDDVEAGRDGLLDSAGYEPTEEALGRFGSGVVECGVSLGELIVAALGRGDSDTSGAFVECVDAEASGELLGEMFLAPGEVGEELMIDIGLTCAHLLDS